MLRGGTRGNWDFNLAGFIFEQLTDRDIYDEVQAQLAIPLQFEDWDRRVQQKAGDLTVSKYAAYPIWVSTRDMARNGAVGQWIAVFPALDLVIAHKTHNIYGRSTSTASWQRIIELLFEVRAVKMTEPYPWAAPSP